MQLTNDALNHRTVAEIQRKVVDQGKRNLFSRLFHARDDQGKITAWGLELDRILRVFNVHASSLFYLIIADCLIFRLS